MQEPVALNVKSEVTKERRRELPPTPPLTEDASSDRDSVSEITEGDLPVVPISRPPVDVLEVDKKTPDAHVPRDPRLIRLTGVHPFNVEPPLTALFNEGFLTPPELFYVRNHGPVPNVKDEDIPHWEFEVSGLVENPFKITLRQLISEYEQITCPITLVCAGNRRKEQNLVRKSKGFSWGSAGVSTALFTGCLLADVIRKARPTRGAKFVQMEGADELPNGPYATSVKLNWVLDPNKGMMLAHKMNGDMLLPDHGKPLRVVIPGQIGGRSVKWLKRLIVSSQPSDSYYHIYDNRVLPTMISPEASVNQPESWKDERYAIYDLSPNAAAAYPEHEEKLSLIDTPEKYRARGYAYSGGGRRITRVELSLDQGKTWRLADIDYAEDRYREVERDLCGGRLDMSWRESCFCWCFWTLDILVQDLASSQDLLVRCMDDSMNIMPRDMYWSVLGMMNNPWFRVTIIKEGDFLKFEHPSQPALMPGGWMERVKKAGGNLTNGHWGEKLGGENTEPEIPEVVKEVSMKKEGLDVSLTIDELRKHDTAENPWFVLNGEVYDGTLFLREHPGGAQSIISTAGMDATDEFMAIHSETAKAMMPKYHIGSLDEASMKVLSEGDVQEQTTTAPPRATFLQSRSWTKAILHEKQTISWDTRIFKFKLEHTEQTLGLPIGQHLMIRLRDPVTREAIIRSYTPISEPKQQGFMDVLVKVYFDQPGAKGGKMSQSLDGLPIGHHVEFKGPIGKFEYLGRGKCTVNEKPRSVGKFLMICGGSGITPILQVFRAVAQDKADPTKCLVLDSNRLVEDILCREDLDSQRKGNEDRLQVVHTLTKATDEWTGLRGRVNGELVSKYCEVEKGTMVLVCGPQALEKSIHQALLTLGWSDEQILFF